MNNVFKDLGGLVWYEEQSASDKSKLLIYKELIKQGEHTIFVACNNFRAEVPISFSIIFNFKLNAIARKVNGNYHIGVFHGTYLLIRDMFDKMLCSRNVLQNCGNINLELFEKQYLLVDETEFHTTFKIGKSSKPLDESRRRRAFCMANFAMKFLITHECGHILRGHLDAFPQGSFELLTTYNSDERVKLNQQTLEVHADSFATNYAFQQLRNLVEKSKRGENSFGETWDWELAISVWIFTVYSQFRLFRFSDMKIKNLLRHTHPTPAIRINLVINTLLRILEVNYNKEFADSFVKTIEKSTEDAEKAFLEVTYDESRHNLFHLTYLDQHIENYVGDLCDNLVEIKKVLAPYEFVKIPYSH